MDYNFLIHKYLSGDINTEEKQLLNEWLASDPLNKQEFEEIKLIWESSEEEEEEVTDEQFQEGLRRLESSIEESKGKEHLIQFHKIRNKYKNVVIATLLLTTVFLFAWIYAGKEPNTTIFAANNKNQELILADNSRVLLNDSSSVSFTMSSKSRKTNIAGEALFEVSNDKRPFIINARDVTITVLGTSFIVKSYPDRPVEVIVISGTVEVEYQNRKVILSQGEKSTVDQFNGIAKSYNDDPNFNAWYTGELEFNKTELKEILTLFEKQFKTTFYVTDPQILSCRFTGRFNNSKLEDVIKTLSFSLDIEFAYRIGNYYEVSGKGCT